MEELLSKHRKEQKDLQGRITQKKKSATKKTRKGVNDDCERMQRELAERQQAEIAELNGDSVKPVEEALEEFSLHERTLADGESTENRTTPTSQAPENASTAPSEEPATRPKLSLIHI